MEDVMSHLSLKKDLEFLFFVGAAEWAARGKDTSIKTAYRDFMYKHTSQVSGDCKSFPSEWEVKSLRSDFKSTHERKKKPAPKYDDMFRHNDEW